MSGERLRSLVASVARLSVNGQRHYPWESMASMDVRFSKSWTHCYLPDGRVLRKLNGGRGGGNFECTETGDVYRVWQH